LLRVSRRSSRSRPLRAFAPPLIKSVSSRLGEYEPLPLRFAVLS
jgi:hypothetical protein